MRAIVLSPGPSLTSFDARKLTDYDLTIGVNRAPIAFAVQAWCCGDLPLVQSTQEQVLGTPLLVTYQVTLDALRDHKSEWRGETRSWTPMADAFLHPSIANWPWTSFTCAIVYAAWQGATQIDVYGADWSGECDWDGAKAGKNRSVDRWRQERDLFGALQIVLGERGHTVTRHLPQEAELGRVG